MSIHKGRIVRGFGTKGPSANIKIRSKHATKKGKIRKHGPDAGKGRAVYATYRAVGSSCPIDCALLDAGCYAQEGNVNIHQRRAGNETFDPVAWAESLPHGSLIRWNVSGDVVGADGADYRDAIHEAHTKRPDLKGWSYTHAWSDKTIVQWMQGLPDNVRIVASMDDPTDVDRARSMGWRTIAQVTETADGKGFTDDEARKVRSESGALPCPAQRVDLGCADCQACGRDGLISFAVHGPGQKKARVSLAARRSLALA